MSELRTCLSSPCFNGGSCTDVTLGGFTCRCTAGFTGSQCEQNIDDCRPAVCGNNSTCVDGVNSYTCRCTPGYTGTGVGVHIGIQVEVVAYTWIYR